MSHTPSLCRLSMDVRFSVDGQTNALLPSKATKRMACYVRRFGNDEERR